MGDTSGEGFILLNQTKVSDELMNWLAKYGWSANRDIGRDADEMVERIEGCATDERFPLVSTPAARAVIHNLGRLKFRRGDSMEDFWSFELPFLRPGEVEDFAELGESLGEAVFPVGYEQPENSILLVDGKGASSGITTPVPITLGTINSSRWTTIGDSSRQVMRRISLSELYPATVTSLLIGGKIFSQSSNVGTSGPNIHPSVQSFVDQHCIGRFRHEVEHSAEVALISDQLWGLDELRGEVESISLGDARSHFEGSVVISRKVRPTGDPENGQATEPGPVCAQLLQALGVEIMRPDAV
ncbi:YwqJ-related putative deaminase [Nocardia sp. NPDC058666]|uniref:YwqJ-related putative deaminase n=1 Tax=unclassified Nocardia TaxID=2637762 RepID=UPI0036650CF5